MKKLLFILFIAVFLGSCKGVFDNVIYTISNDSSKNITFTFNDITNTLQNGESIIYVINSEQGRFTIEDIKLEEHPRSITLTTINKGTAGIFYTFIDNIPLNLNVKNNLSIPVTVKADNFIAAGVDTGVDAYDEEKFTLKIFEKGEETALIYTSTPGFSVRESAKEERTLTIEEDGYIPYPYPYSISFDWEFIEDNNTINLIIK